MVGPQRLALEARYARLQSLGNAISTVSFFLFLASIGYLLYALVTGGTWIIGVVMAVGVIGFTFISTVVIARARARVAVQAELPLVRMAAVSAAEQSTERAKERIKAARSASPTGEVGPAVVQQILAEEYAAGERQGQAIVDHLSKPGISTARSLEELEEDIQRT